jgi:hypothetical protein
MNVSCRQRTSRGFTLVMTLSILAAVTILVVGLFGLVSRERQTSGTFDAVEQAELAVQAGLEQAGSMLKEALDDETGVIMSVPTPAWVSEADVETDKSGRLRSELGKKDKEVLMAARTGTDGLWAYSPLISGAVGSDPRPPFESDPVLAGLKSIRLVAPGMTGGAQLGSYVPRPGRALAATAEEAIELKRVTQQMAAVEPWMRSAPCYWVEFGLPPGEGKAEDVVKGRFCFVIDDLQGKLNLGTAGDVDPNAVSATAALPLREKPFFRVLSNGQTETVHSVPGLNLANDSRPLLNQTSLFTLLQANRDPLATDGSLNSGRLSMHRQLLSLRAMHVTPGAWRESLMQPDSETAWAGFSDPALFSNRFPANSASGTLVGSLQDPVFRSVEENTMHQLVPYEELALIPPDPAFSENWVAGLRKMNLNRWLEEVDALQGTARRAKATEAINAIAQHIQTFLDVFGTERMGGYSFPVRNSNVQERARAYLRCLAAGILDYADKDSVPNMDGDPFVDPLTGNASAYPTYRGMDNFPVVSEQWQRYRFEGSENGTVTVSVTHYLELWNMTNQRISGEISAAYEINADVTIGFRTFDLLSQGLAAESGRPEREKLPSDRGGFLPGAWHVPVRIDSPTAPVTPALSEVVPLPAQRPMEPNEVRVISFPPVKMKLSAGTSGAVTAVDIVGRDPSGSDTRSRYRLAFRPTGSNVFSLVDQPLRAVERFTRNVTTSAANRQRFNTTHPGMSYALANNNYANNLGDPRASFFINYSQDVVNYDQGSSPWGRNVRTNIGATLFYRENRTALWPDGGHNAAARPGSIGLINRDPGDPVLRPAIHAALPASNLDGMRERQKYVQVISNRGRLSSVTELGNVFDPIMWDPNGGSEFDTPKQTDFVNIKLGTSGVKASDKFCGGYTLCIGRPEHPRFRPDYGPAPATGAPVNRSRCATALLDLFHVGIPRSADPLKRMGDLVRIDGHVNLNTATFDTLRALVAGRLVTDPRLKLDSAAADPTLTSPVALQPPTSRPFVQMTETDGGVGDLVAELIIRNRPYLSPAELPEKLRLPTSAELAQRPYQRVRQVDVQQKGVVYTEGQPILGASKRPSELSIEPEWSDAAAEEAFARIFNNATVRSRHFRVVVTGQAVVKTRSETTKVLATRSRVYHVFVRPIRDANGNLVRQQTEILYARTL